MEPHAPVPVPPPPDDTTPEPTSPPPDPDALQPGPLSHGLVELSDHVSSAAPMEGQPPGPGDVPAACIPPLAAAVVHAALSTARASFSSNQSAGEALIKSPPRLRSPVPRILTSSHGGAPVLRTSHAQDGRRFRRRTCC